MNITDSAAKKVAALILEENKPEVKMLRIFVQGGGCSGFQYGFAFAEAVEADDLSFTNGDVTVVVDSISQQYLDDAELDYQDDNLNGSRFIVRNPLAKGTCGCGESFNT